MKILFFSHYFPPEVNAPASRTFDHCARWVREGHDVTVVTCAPNCPDGVLFPGYRNRLKPQLETIDGIRVIRTWTYLAANSGTARRIANYVSYMVSATLTSLRVARPDVIIATSPQFFCGWAGVFASWLKWAPLVIEIRDIWPESIVAVGALKEGTLLRVLEWMERRMYRSAAHIVAVGNGYKIRIQQKVNVDGRISVITNGVDLKLFTPRDADRQFLQRWNLGGKFVCSYVGTIGMAHGLEIVTEAAKILREKGRDDITFCLVGDGASRQRLEDEVRREGLEPLVVFAGRLPKEAMPDVLASSGASLIHLKKCDLFEGVIPSKIFETMAMGVPIIMGVRGEARDIVASAGAGIDIEPENPVDLVHALEALADDPKCGQQLGQSGRDFVDEFYNRDALAMQYLATLQAVARRSTATSARSPAKPVAASETAENRDPLGLDELPGKRQVDR